jgi:hypothetical protein
MSNDRIRSAGAAPGAQASDRSGALGAHHGRVSTFAGSSFRLVPTPPALQKLPSPGAFEKQTPLRPLAATGVQRQLLRESQRPAKAMPPAAQATEPAIDSPSVNSDEPQEAQSEAPSRRAKGAADRSQGAPRYRVVARQTDRHQAQQQFARSGLPGAELLTEAGERTAVRPALRLALATGLRAAADLPLRSDGLPSPQTAQMVLLQAYLQVTPREESALNLGGVKQLLMTVCEQLPPRSSEGTPAGERRSDLLLLLPLMLLNAERPRTAEQRQAAKDRLGLMCASRAMF